MLLTPALESPPPQEVDDHPLALSHEAPSGSLAEDRIVFAIASVSLSDGCNKTLLVCDGRPGSLRFPSLPFPAFITPLSGSGFRQTEELTVNTAMCFDDARPCAA